MVSVRSIGRLFFWLALVGAARAELPPWARENQTPDPQGRTPVILDGADVLALPGKPVLLSAKLERDELMRRDVPGKKVVFQYQGAVLGSPVTDKQGVAALSWTPPTAGELEVTVRFDGDGKFAPRTGSLLCAVRLPTRRAIVLDIDHTLCETSMWDVVTGQVDSPPLPHSRETVVKLAGQFSVFYVTARLNKFQGVTRRWLEHYGFPRLPTFFLDWKQYPSYNEAKYKTRIIGELKASFPALFLGIGDKQSDALAYRACNLRALILGDPGSAQGAEPVMDWFELDQMVFEGPRARGARLAFDQLRRRLDGSL